MTNDVRGADLRLRYRVAADQREAAKAAAQRKRDELIAAGAASVKLEEVVLASVRARAPEVAEARTSWDQIVRLWSSKTDAPAAERHDGIRAKLGTIEEPGECARAAGGSLRFDSVRLRGIGPYREETHVDFAALPGRLTAICGQNGSGKSVLLGSLLGGIFRDVPGRGSLMDLATERGAFVEVHAVNGAPWTIRQTVDPISKRSETLILDAAGRPLLDDAKVRSGDAWVRDHLPPVEVLLSSVFAAQGSEGFLSMRPAERKSVLLRLLGVERLEAVAAAARERARETKQALAVLEARIGDERRRGGDVEALRAQLEQERAAVADAHERLAVARDRLEKAREADAAAARRRELAGRLAPLEARKRALRGTLEQADEIRAAVDEHEGATAAHAEATAKAREEREAARRIRDELARLRADFERAKTAAAEAEQRAARARARLADRERIEEAVCELPAAREAVAAAERAVESTRATLERLQSQRVAGAEDRIVALRQGLTSIEDAEAIGQAQSFAAHTLDVDNAAVRTAAELPDFIAAARRDLADAEARARTAERHARQLERDAARAADLERAAEDLAAAEAERDARRAEMRETRDRGAALVEDAKAHEASAQEHEDHARALSVRLATLHALASQADRLTAAEAQLAEVETQAAALRAEIEALGPALVAAPVSYAEREASDCEASLRSAERRVTTAETTLAQAEAAAGRVAELEAERATVEADLADWNVLARDLGRDGVQAALIDAAGPELTAMVNDLLQNALGSRWTVSIETTRASADGKRQLEGLDVRVIDTERGRDALVETYSGGERVLLGEAVSLALTMLACRRSGLEGVTLVRDESGAALDPDRARAYVAMLRRAADLVGASRVLLVSHSPEVVELCDCRLTVADGRVEVTA